ncbi:MAG: tetratricopeptide repeat protein [Steroidobacteraceae bacterium]
MNTFIGELRRRNVFRVAVAYLVTAWLLLQVADVVLETIEAPPWAMKAVLLVLLLGLPLALVVAWVFELTPEGLRRESEVDRSRSIARQTGRRLDYAIIAILVLAVALLVYDRQRGADPGLDPPAAETAVKSIAVMPFVNMSPDPNNEYFSDGISEELLNLLAKVDGLKVAARTSSFKFKGTKTDINEIGTALGVATVLEGSVRKSADQVRITAQLIKVEDGFHLWSATYDRSLDNIFEVQDEIAGAIVEALKLPLLGTTAAPVSAKPTQNVAAYDLYLLGRHRMRETRAASFREAIGYFQRAIEADPDFAPAHSGLADAYVLLSNYGDMPQGQAYAAAEPAIDRALALDPELAEAWTSKGLLADARNRSTESMEYLQKALALNPNSGAALLGLADTQYKLGRSKDAIESSSRALELDPMSDFFRQQHLVHMNQAGRSGESLQRAKAWAEKEPQNPFPFEAIGDAYLTGLGQPQRAVAAYARAHDLRPGDTYMAARIVAAFLEMNDLPSAKLWLEKARERGPRTFFTVRSDYLVARYQDDAATQDELLRRHLRLNPDSIDALAALARLQIEAEDLVAAEATARRLLDVLNDSLNSPVTLAVMSPALDLALIHQRRGELAESERWLGRLDSFRDALIDSAPHDKTGHLLSARIASIRGDREAMLDALRTAVQRGLRGSWLLRTDPAFAQWRQDRLFQGFLAEMERQSAALREEFVRSPGGAALMAQD